MNPPERLVTPGGASLGEQTLDALLEPHGPAAPAWLTRVHRALAQQWPGACVFRLHYPMESLTWDPLESTCRHASLSIL